MTSQLQTGRYWICPGCGRQSSAGLSTCRCGHRRTASGSATAAPVGRRAAARRGAFSGGRAAWWLSGTVLGLGLLAIGGGIGYGALRSRLIRELRAEMAARTGTAAPASTEATAAPATGTSTPPTHPPRPAERDWTAMEHGTFGALSVADREQALALARRLDDRGGFTDADVVNAEALQRRYPAEDSLRQLLGAVLTRSADQRRSRGDLVGARELLEQGSSLFPSDRSVRRSRLVLLVEMRDWPGAEAAARSALAADSQDPDARRALALALAARGQDREALRALYSALEVVTNSVDEPQLRSLRDQIERRLWATSGCEGSQLPDPARTGEAGMRLERFLALLSSCSGGSVGQQLSHFSVAYRRAMSPPDPGRWVQVVSLEAVGRDVLRLLEKQYSTLTSALDHEMSRTIPVVVLEDAEYRVSTGAPEWSGGQFDSDDGTITVPVNVFQRITFQDPELERWWSDHKETWIETALLHETAHAFIDEITQGNAPRSFNEGLAKYLEREVTKERQDLTATLQLGMQERYGREQAGDELARAVEEFRTEDLGRSSTVFTTYVGGELFVEYLVKQRGMGGIRSVLKGIASTHSVDAAFEDVFGRGYDGTRRAWLDWLRGQWGVSAPRRT